MRDPVRSDSLHGDPLHPDSVHPDAARSGPATPCAAEPAPSGASPATGRWLVRLPGAERVDRLTELNDDLMRAGRPSRRRRVLVAAARLAATFAIGVAATLAWQPYGDAARIMIANASPQFGWLAPQSSPDTAAPARQRPMDAATLSDLDAVRDRIDRIASTQEQMTRAVAQLTTGQQHIAEEIAKVREVEQYLLYKTSYKGEETAAGRPAAAPAGQNQVGHKLTRRPTSTPAR